MLKRGSEHSGKIMNVVERLVVRQDIFIHQVEEPAPVLAAAILAAAASSAFNKPLVLLVTNLCSHRTSKLQVIQETYRKVCLAVVIKLMVIKMGMPESCHGIHCSGCGDMRYIVGHPVVRAVFPRLGTDKRGEFHLVLQRSGRQPSVTVLRIQHNACTEGFI